MLGLVVYTDYSIDARIKHVVFLRRDGPLLYIRPPKTDHLRSLPKEERKLIEKVFYMLFLT